MRGSKVDRMGDTALSGQDGRWTKVFRSRTFQLQTTVKPLALSTYKLPNRRNGPEHVTSPEPPPTVNSQPPHIRLGTDSAMRRSRATFPKWTSSASSSTTVSQAAAVNTDLPARASTSLHNEHGQRRGLVCPLALGSHFHITPQRAWPAPWPRLPARASPTACGGRRTSQASRDGQTGGGRPV